jgi:hypothetical protein
MHEDVAVEVLGSRFDYDYEYLGDCTHPVWIPQFESGVFALLSAFRLRHFPLVRGVTGSGKLKLVGEAARLLGRPLTTRAAAAHFDSKSVLQVKWRTSLITTLMPKKTYFLQYIRGVSKSGAWLLLRDFDSLPETALSALVPHLHDFRHSLLSSTPASAKGFICFGVKQVAKLPHNLKVISVILK